MVFSHVLHRYCRSMRGSVRITSHMVATQNITRLENQSHNRHCCSQLAHLSGNNEILCKSQRGMRTNEWILNGSRLTFDERRV